MPSPPPATPPTEPQDSLPVLRTPLRPDQTLDRLEAAAKRGLLPGFGRGGRGLFSVEAHGHPFDAELIATGRPSLDGGTELRFKLRLRRRLPALFAAGLVATVWPGVYLMDQLVPGEWGFIGRHVYWWYIPLTALPLPWVWRTLIRRSSRSNGAAAREAVATIAAQVGATVG